MRMRRLVRFRVSTSEAEWDRANAFVISTIAVVADFSDLGCRDFAKSCAFCSEVSVGLLLLVTLFVAARAHAMMANVIAKYNVNRTLPILLLLIWK